jgi:hypothetical protein
MGRYHRGARRIARTQYPVCTSNLEIQEVPLDFCCRARQTLGGVKGKS